MKNTTWITLLITIASFIITGCSYQQIIKHPTSILVTTGSDVGSYKSLGTISTNESFWTVAFGITGVSANHLGVSGGHTFGIDLSDDELQRLQDLINEYLVEEVKKMGGNAVIGVRYSYSKVPILLPGLFGIALEGFSVSGEVVKLK